MKKSNLNSYITSWGLQQSITNKIPTTERLRLYKHWKNWCYNNIKPCIIWRGIVYEVYIANPKTTYKKGNNWK